jgi:hypothetical protein
VTHERFRELFVVPRACPADLADTERVVRVLVVSDAKTFQSFLEAADSGVALRDAGIYEPQIKRIICRADAAQWDGGDELRCAGGRTQNVSDQTLAALVTSQLMHEYQALHGGRVLQEEDPWSPFPPFFLVHGVAGLLSSFEFDDGAPLDLADTEFHHGRILLAAAEVGRRHRKAGHRIWSLRDLVRPRHSSDAYQAAFALRSAPPREMVHLFWAQSWAFAHFCWYYDGGKYREPFRTLVQDSLRGRTLTPAVVAESFGAASADDWGTVQVEYSWYWESCLNRKVGPKVDPRRDEVIGWWTPETAPPRGAMPPPEDD